MNPNVPFPENTGETLQQIPVSQHSQVCKDQQALQNPLKCQQVKA